MASPSAILHMTCLLLEDEHSFLELTLLSHAVSPGCSVPQTEPCNHFVFKGDTASHFPPPVLRLLLQDDVALY